jgi:hypothetical protein
MAIRLDIKASFCMRGASHKESFLNRSTGIRFGKMTLDKKNCENFSSKATVRPNNTRKEVDFRAITRDLKELTLICP